MINTNSKYIINYDNINGGSISSALGNLFSPPDRIYFLTHSSCIEEIKNDKYIDKNQGIVNPELISYEINFSQITNSLRGRAFYIVNQKPGVRFLRKKNVENNYKLDIKTQKYKTIYDNIIKSFNEFENLKINEYSDCHILKDIYLLYQKKIRNIFIDKLCEQIYMKIENTYNDYNCTNLTVPININNATDRFYLNKEKGITELSNKIKIKTPTGNFSQFNCIIEVFCDLAFVKSNQKTLVKFRITMLNAQDSTQNDSMSRSPEDREEEAEVGEVEEPEEI
jgi:hypothetical protein